MQLLLMKISNWLMGEPKKKRIVKFKKVIKKSKKFI